MFHLLAAATDSKLTDALTLLIVGMAVVFGSLAVLLAVVALINRLLHEAPAPGSAATARARAVDDTELVAVLAAAATVALGRSVRVTDVQPVSENTRS